MLRPDSAVYALRLAALATLLLAAQGAAPGCLRVEPGIEVALSLSWVDAAPDAWLPLGDGSEVHLDDGLAWIRSASLLPCEEHAHDPAARAPRPRPVIDRLLRVLVPTAHAQHAHGGGDGTFLLGPLALSPAERVHVGTFTPVPGSYCAVHVVLGADEGPAIATTGTTSTGAPVSAWSAAEGWAHLPLEAPLVLDRPGLVTLEATLFSSHPFANLTSLPLDAHALGAHLVGGSCGGTARPAGSGTAHEHHD